MTGLPMIKTLQARYLHARKIAAQTYLDKMIEELEFADNKNIAIVREKLHHYRWMASKLIGIYGDKQEIKQDTNIQITWSNSDQEEIKDVTNSVSTDSANSVSHTT